MKRGIVRVPNEVVPVLKKGFYIWPIISGNQQVFGKGLLEFNGKEVKIKKVYLGSCFSIVGVEDYWFDIPNSWIEPIEEEPSIDWSRVKVDAPIEIMLSGNWHKRHFAELNGNMPAYWMDGKTSYTSRPTDRGTASLDAIRFQAGVNPEDWYLDSEKKGFKCYCGGKLSYKINDKEGLTPEARLYLKCEKCGHEEHYKESENQVKGE